MRTVWPALLLVCLLESGCALTERDLDAFRSSATGPEKLRAVLMDPSQAPQLRAHAGLTLLEIKRADLDGKAALLSDFKATDEGSREELSDPIAEGLRKRMTTAVGVAPSELSLLAKDTGVEMLAMLSGSLRTQLGKTLLSWTLEDLEKRAEAGRHNMTELVAALGREAVSPLLSSLSVSLSAGEIGRLAALLDEHAAEPDRGRVAERLVDVERSFRSREHDARLIEIARGELAGSGASEHSEVLKTRVNVLRHAGLSEHILPALGRFADQDVARTRLLSIARDASIEDSDRTQALLLLTGRTTHAELTALLTLALDEREEAALRELAVARAGETKEAEAVPLLLTLVSDRSHPQLRQRATELVLEIGGARALSALFRSMPRAVDAAYAKDELDAYSERIERFQPEPQLIMMFSEKLHSAFWYNRVLALRYFARRGVFEDIWRIRQHLGDTLPVFGDGWPRGYTVGQEAEACVAIATERLTPL